MKSQVSITFQTDLKGSKEEKVDRLHLLLANLGFNKKDVDIKIVDVVDSTPSHEAITLPM
jgi:hypothetical protein